MPPSFRLIAAINAVIVIFYVLYNWAEFNEINYLGSQYQTNYMLNVHAQFPWQIDYSNTVVQYFPDQNFPLLLFLIAISVNLYFIYTLQRKASKKPLI